MSTKKFYAFMGVSALIFMLALAAGGCGGNSSSIGTNSGSGTVSFSGHHILMGASGRTDSEMSELYPYIRNLITDTFDVARLADLDTDGLLVTSRDIIFLEDASTIKASDIDLLMPLQHAFYNRHVTIAAIYPDSEDVEALSRILGVKLADPSDEPYDKHYEVLAAGMRYTSGDSLPHTYVYVDTCYSNKDYYPSHIELDHLPQSTINVPTESWDEYFGETVTTPSAQELAERQREAEENDKQLLAERTQYMIDWANGIDARLEASRAQIIEASSRLAYSVAEETGGVASEIIKFVGGIHTDFSDSSVTNCFYDYDWARRHGDQASVWNNWADYSGCNDYDTLKDYWNSFKPGLNVSGTYVTYGVHSFDDHNDYYLITLDSTIQPPNLEIRAEYGDKTGDEVSGSGAYHYAVVLGSNKQLSCYQWPDQVGVELVKLTPNMTVNNNQSFSDSDGWTMGGGVSGEGGGGGGSGGQRGGGEGHGKGEVSFNYSVTHNSQYTWNTTDYSITPKREITSYPPAGRTIAGWVLDVSEPSYSGGNGWIISAAAKTAVTLVGEAIWRVPSSLADSFSFTTQAHWSEGFYAAHDMGGRKVSDANCVINHDSGLTKLNFTKPIPMGLGDATTHGTNEGKTYYAKLYTESDWKAESDSKWLQLTSKSGKASNGADFGYTATANNTNADRTGNITITAGNNTLTLTFIQSRYAQ